MLTLPRTADRTRHRPRQDTGNGDFGSKTITVAELAQLVEGKKPVELFEPLESGIWLRVHIDTACSIEQQYRP